MTVTHRYADEPTAVYRIYDANGVLLYLGIARFPEGRLREHKESQPWWHLVTRYTVEWHKDRHTARDIEISATAEEKPLYDREWRRGPYAPEGGYDATADQRLVWETVAGRIEDGTYPAGTVLGTGEISGELVLARTTVRYVLDYLAREVKILQEMQPGRWAVTGTPVPDGCTSQSLTSHHLPRPQPRASREVPVKEIVQRYQEGESVAALNATFRLGQEGIRKLLKDNQVVLRRGRKQLPVPVEELVRRYRDERVQLQDMAAEYGVCVPVISQRLAEAGCRVPVGARRLDLPVEEIVARFDAGESQIKIAAAYGVSVPTIVKRLTEQGRLA